MKLYQTPAIQYIIKNFLVGLAYLSTAYVGLMLVVPPLYATLIWPPAGIAQGALLVCGRRLWVGVLAGAFVFNISHVLILTEQVFDISVVLAALSIASGSTIQVIVGYLLINHFVGLPLNLAKIKETILVFFLAGPIACLIAPTFGVSTLYAMGKIDLDEFRDNWVTWWGGDILGVLVFLPFMLVSPIGGPRKFFGSKVSNKLPALSMFVLILPLGLTFYAWKISAQYIYEKNYAYFNVMTREAEISLVNRLNSYKQNLVSGSSYFMGHSRVTREDWKEYVDTLNLDVYSPGLNGLGFVTYLSKRDEGAFVACRQAESEAFTVHPETSDPYKFIITYVEPEENNSMAIGYDIASEKNRYDAAITAMKTGETTITRKISLIQDASHSPAFLMLYPIYNKPLKYLRTPQARVNNFVGWVYAPFIGEKFLQELPAHRSHTLDLEVYDGETINDSALIFNTFDSGEPDNDHSPRYKAVTTMNVLQQKWTMVWTSTAAFENTADSHEPFIILIGGLTLTTLMGVVMFMLSHRTEIVQQIVDEKIREISSTEVKMALLIKNTPASVAMFDRGMRYIAASDRWYSEYHLMPEKTIGTEYFELFSDILNIDDWKATYDRVLGGEVINCDETTWKGANGKRIWVRYALHPWVNAKGEVGGIVAFTENITERKTVENALKSSEQTFRAAMEYASIGKSLVSLDGKFMKVNSAFCELLGYSEDELRTMTFQEITYAEDLQMDLNHVQSLLDGDQKAYQIEKRYIHKSGRILWTTLNVSLVRDSEGRPQYFVSEVNDITQKKEIERLKDEFISITSHELRTPITSTNLALNLLSKSLPEGISVDIKTYVDMARRNSEKLMYLINDILDTRKISVGKMEYDISRQNLSEILRQVTYENRGYGDKYGVTFNVKDIPDEIYINVDASRVAQVVVNLLSNAAKFSDRGDMVDIYIERQNGNVRTCVKDYGCGIPKEYHDRVFGQFSQVDSSMTRKKEGSGLGLFICKEMIEKMGGRIGFDSDRDQGALFWFEFKEA